MRLPAAPPPLPETEVHVWHLVASQPPDEATLKLLAVDEVKRAAAFRFEADRSTYQLARCALRTLAGAYLEQDAAALQFSYTEYQKPQLPGTGLRFNVSHSNRNILIAFCRNHAVGVDIEYHDRSVEVAEIAERFFAPRECAALFALPEAEWRPAFFRAWTRKEAFIKAKGGGLSIPLHDFEVTLGPADAPRLTHIAWDEADVPHWEMTTFDCGPQYTSAAIVHGIRPQWRYFRLQ